MRACARLSREEGHASPGRFMRKVAASDCRAGSGRSEGGPAVIRVVRDPWAVVVAAREARWSEVLETFRSSVATHDVLREHVPTASVAAAAIAQIGRSQCTALAAQATQTEGGERRAFAVAQLAWCGSEFAPLLREELARAAPSDRGYLLLALASVAPDRFGPEATQAVQDIDADTLSGLIFTAGAQLPLDWSSILGAIVLRLQRSPERGVESALLNAVLHARAWSNDADRALLQQIDRLSARKEEALGILSESNDEGVRSAVAERLRAYCGTQRSRGFFGFIERMADFPSALEYLWMSDGPAPLLQTGPGTFSGAGQQQVSYVCPGSPAEIVGYRSADRVCLARPDAEGRGWVQRGRRLVRLRPAPPGWAP